MFSRKVLRSEQSVKYLALFNLEGTDELTIDSWQLTMDVPCKKMGKIWGFSSAGRAPALQAGGQRFDPANLHQNGPIAQLARAHDW